MSLLWNRILIACALFGVASGLVLVNDNARAWLTDNDVALTFLLFAFTTVLLIIMVMPRERIVPGMHGRRRGGK